MASGRKLTLIRDQFASRQRAIDNGKQRNFLTSIRSVSYNFSVSIIACDVVAVVVTVANISRYRCLSVASVLQSIVCDTLSL